MSDHTKDSLIKFIDEAQRHGWGIVGITDKPFGRKLIEHKRWGEICQQLRQRDELLEASRDLLDAFWDMSPLQYAQSRGLPFMSDEEGERIKKRVRMAIAKT